MRRPVADNVPITQNYGKTSFSANHNGIDFSGRFDKNIYAPESGTLGYQSQPTLGGNVLTLKTGNREHRLAHLSSMVKKSGSVSEGQVLGVMGATGKATAVHLHWGVLVNGSYVNPLTLVGGGSNTNDMPRVRIPPELVAQHYANFVNRNDIKSTDPVCQNRFEDTVDDEFWYGLIFMMNDQKKAHEKEIASLKKQLADTTGEYVETKVYIKKA